MQAGNLYVHDKTNPSPRHMTEQITLFSGRDAPDTFKKAVQVVHSMPLSTLTLLQRKMLNSWLKHAAQSTRDPNDWYELRLDAMSIEIDFNSKNRPHLKESAEKLMRIVFQWDVIAPETKRVKWKASVLFPDVEIHSEVVRFKISDQIRDQVLSPEMYAWIDQGVLRKYRRAASVGVYEHCMRYSKLGKTAVVKWEMFRDMIMGASSNLVTYQHYKFFKSKVLVGAVNEVNTEGALAIELFETKEGREVIGVYFTVKVPRASINGIAFDEESQEQTGQLVKIGVPPSEAKRLVREHSANDISVALHYTNERRQNKKAEKLLNVAAYFRKALNEKWKPVQLVDDGITDVEDKVVNRVEPAKPDVNGLFKLHQISEVEKYFSKLDLEDQSAFIERYNSQQTMGALIMKQKATRASQTAFQQWLIRDLWGEPDATQLLAFAESLIRKQSELLEKDHKQ